MVNGLDGRSCGLIECVVAERDLSYDHKTHKQLIVAGTPADKKKAKVLHLTFIKRLRVLNMIGGGFVEGRLFRVLLVRLLCAESALLMPLDTTAVAVQRCRPGIDRARAYDPIHYE